MIFVISDRPTLIFQKTYHYNGLKRPYERKYILYLLYKFDLLLRHYKALPENQVARDELLMGTPETPELVGVGWDLALAYVLCPCC